MRDIIISHIGGTLEVISLGIELFGIGIVLWGFLQVSVRLLLVEVRHNRDQSRLAAFHDLRIVLGTYLLLGLEFLIASDIIHTLISRELNDLIFVGVLVAIRTAISYFLDREIGAMNRPGEPHTRRPQ